MNFYAWHWITTSAETADSFKVEQHKKHRRQVGEGLRARADVLHWFDNDTLNTRRWRRFAIGIAKMVDNQYNQHLAAKRALSHAHTFHASGFSVDIAHISNSTRYHPPRDEWNHDCYVQLTERRLCRKGIPSAPCSSPCQILKSGAYRPRSFMTLKCCRTSLCTLAVFRPVGDTVRCLGPPSVHLDSSAHIALGIH